MAGGMGRGSATYAAIAVALLAIVQCAMAATYTVGDTAGWSLNVNFTNWAKQSTFKVGDSLVFKYSPGVHSVFQVDEANYKACNVPAAPLKSYTSGNDAVVLTDATTHYFICGTPGHCTAGMYVAISVSGGSTPSAPPPAPTVSPAPKVSPTPSPPKAVPSPSPAPTVSPAPKVSPMPSPPKAVPSPAPAHTPVSSSTSPSPTSPSSPSPSSEFPSPPPISSTPSSLTPSSQAQSPSTSQNNAASTVYSGTMVLLSAVLLGGFSLFF